MVVASEGEARGGEVLDGRYRLITPIGQGASGVVYLAEHLALGSRVAVKLLEPAEGMEDQVERFRREAKAAARLRSPHIVRAFDFGRLDDGTLFFVMEKLLGETLHRVLQREGTLDAVRTVRLLSQVASALDSAHAQGVVHRDLKPENVFLVTDVVYEELVKILDFGVARQMFDQSELTRDGSMLGTPGFLPPEQAFAGPDTEIGPASDVYALAAMALEMLTGGLPYPQQKPLELLRAMQSGEPQLPSDLGLEVAGLDAVFAKALARDPRDRHPSASRFVQALANASGQPPESAEMPVIQSETAEGAPPVSTAPVPPPKPSTSPAPAGLAWPMVGALIAMSLLLGWLLGNVLPM